MKLSSCPLPASPKCDDGAVEFGGGAELIQNAKYIEYKRELDTSPHLRLTSFREAQMGGLRGADFGIMASFYFEKAITISCPRVQIPLKLEKNNL